MEKEQKNKDTTFAAEEATKSSDQAEEIWNQHEVHEVRTSASHIARNKKDEPLKLPRTKRKSLIERLSRRNSGKSIHGKITMIHNTLPFCTVTPFLPAQK